MKSVVPFLAAVVAAVVLGFLAAGTRALARDAVDAYNPGSIGGWMSVHQVLEIPQKCDRDAVAILCDRGDADASTNGATDDGIIGEGGAAQRAAQATSAPPSDSPPPADDSALGDYGSLYDYENQYTTGDALAAAPIYSGYSGAVLYVPAVPRASIPPAFFSPPRARLRSWHPRRVGRAGRAR